MGGHGHTEKKRKQRKGTDRVAYLCKKKWSLEETEEGAREEAKVPPDVNIAPTGTSSRPPSCALHCRRSSLAPVASQQVP